MSDLDGMSLGHVYTALQGVLGFPSEWYSIDFGPNAAVPSFLIVIIGRWFSWYIYTQVWAYAALCTDHERHPNQVIPGVRSRGQLGWKYTVQKSSTSVNSTCMSIVLDNMSSFCSAKYVVITIYVTCYIYVGTYILHVDSHVTLYTWQFSHWYHVITRLM